MQYVALACFLGGPLFWGGVWNVLDTPDMRPITRQVWRRVCWGTVLGAGAFLLAAYAEALRVASDVIHITDFGALWEFMTGTRYGHMTLGKSVLVPGVLASFFWVSAPRVRWVGTTLCGLALLLTISLTSHAAAKPGLAPLVGDIAHLAGAVVWSGCLLYFASLPWQAIRHHLTATQRVFWRLIERVSTIALVAVSVLLGSGAVLAFLHVYGLAALSETPYGRRLTQKIVLLVLALGVAGWQLLRLNPALKRLARAAMFEAATALLGRCAWLARVETSLVLGALCLAGVLTTLSPAERPAHVTPMTWERVLGDWRLQVTMLPSGEPGHVQFDIALTSMHGLDIPPAMPLIGHLRMREHDMGTRPREATGMAPGRYLLPGRLSMAGTWEVALTWHPAGAPLQTTFLEIEAPTGALDQDRSRRLEWAALSFTPLALFSGLLGGLLGGLAVVTLWASRRGRMPVWATPFGLTLLAGGAFLVLRVVLVDAYPTTYVNNPVSGTPAVLAQGRALFLEHCATCHGATGQGDGALAATLPTRPADLSAAHVDDHTDGDLFWWLTHGMPGTAMPGWEAQLAAPSRWTLIRYIRSLRQGKT